MKLLLSLCLVGFAYSSPVDIDFQDAEIIDGGFEDAAQQYEPISIHYHESFGIKEAARIKAAEETSDFDGSRIVGGSAANLGQYPHMGGLVITLTNGQQSVCGSSLLTNNRAVTAAHCWWDGQRQARQFVVVLGSLTLFSGGTRVTTTNVQMHGSWNWRTAVNDVAIIVHNWVNFNNNIRGIALASGNNQFVGSWAWAAGFGRQGDNVGIGNNQRLHHVQLQIITNAECQRVYGGSVVASTICTSGANRRSICSGDSGGPLQVGNQLVGITSFGHRNGCQLGFPQGFARVTSFNAWIRQRL